MADARSTQMLDFRALHDTATGETDAAAPAPRAPAPRAPVPRPAATRPAAPAPRPAAPPQPTPPADALPPGTAQPVRSLVLWFPDWPVTALLRDTGTGPSAYGLDEPIAVVERNLVVACSAAARAEGVRRGQRRRDAQAACPGLTIVPSDPARDARAFSPVVSAVEEQAPGVQIVRPGLCALRARGPARYYGGEASAAQVLRQVLAAHGLEGVRAGVADGPFTAEQAARFGTGPDDPVSVIDPGAAASFLARLPVTVLGDVWAAWGATDDLVGLLARLGVQTLGDFAGLERDRVRERFGDRGLRLHALAAGQDSHPVQPTLPASSCAAPALPLMLAAASAAKPAKAPS